LQSGVKVYALSPGVVDTAMQAHIREADVSQFSEVERFKGLKKKGELLDPVEVSRRVIDFINDNSKYQDTILRLDIR